MTSGVNAFEYERPSQADSVHEHIAATLREWVEHHPAPELPALSLAEWGEYSPRQLCQAVEEESEIGRFLEVLIVNGVSRHPDGLQGVLASFAHVSPVPR